MRQMNTLKRVLRYIRHYRGLVAASIALAMLTVALTLYVPVLTGRAIDGIVEKGRVDFFLVLDALLQIGGVVGVTAVGQWMMNVINNRITYDTVRDIRAEAFQKLQRLPLSYLDERSGGQVVSRLITDVDQFADGLLMGFTQLFTGVMTILGTLLFMLSVNVRITLVVVLITPVSLLAASFIAKRTYDMFRQQSQLRAEQTALVEEAVSGQKVVKAFSQEEQMEGRFAEVNGRLEKCSVRAIFFSSITNPVTRFVNGLVYAGVGIVGAFTALSGGITVGMLSCFLSYANQYTKPFNEISGVATELQNALACAARIFELLDEKEQAEDGQRTLVRAKGQVGIEQVYFSYQPGQRLIEDFCLQVEPGQRVAIVGPTGCGKTTMINLLMRFYEVDGGVIRVDGQDIRTRTRESLRRSYGMVLQETWLREGTVLDNVAFGRPNASRAEIEEACKAAHCHSFIMRLPQGYDTVIGEDKGGLSQGQKQLLCIARVMLALPPMLILDEATSSIDTRTELKIQEAFARMMQGRTSFIVAHRLSTIRSADVIVVMRDGRIVEMGRHQALLDAGGFYAQLYNSQFAH